MRFKFPKVEIIRGKRTFEEVVAQGEAVRGKTLRCLVLSRPLKQNLRQAEVLVAFSAGRGMKRATDRNRIKRLMRESYRLNRFSLQSNISDPPGQVLLLFSLYRKPLTVEQIPTFSEIEKDMKFILSKVAKICDA